MDPYRLFVTAMMAGSLITQAEAICGSFAAELLDVEGLRIVKYLPGNGEASSEAAE